MRYTLYIHVCVRWYLLLGRNFFSIDETSWCASTFHGRTTAQSVESGESTERGEVSSSTGALQQIIEWQMKAKSKRSKERSAQTVASRIMSTRSGPSGTTTMKTCTIRCDVFNSLWIFFISFNVFLYHKCVLPANKSSNGIPSKNSLNTSSGSLKTNVLVKCESKSSPWRRLLPGIWRPSLPYWS